MKEYETAAEYHDYLLAVEMEDPIVACIGDHETNLLT